MSKAVYKIVRSIGKLTNINFKVCKGQIVFLMGETRNITGPSYHIVVVANNLIKQNP